MAGELRWFELELLCANTDSDLLTTLLYERGFEGSQIRSQPKASKYEPGDQLLVYLQAPDQRSADEAADQLFATLPSGIAQRGALVELEPTLWTENWKAHFPRLRIGRTLEIVPPWEAPSSERGLVSVVINPAMAFGTGHHETTSACLGRLEQYLRPGDTVADVGTGSGILAIAALKLGAHRATATDNDEEAVNSARHNAVINGVGNRIDVLLADCLPQNAAKDGDYDLVVANILAAALVEMAPRLTRSVRQGGSLILSGIDLESLPLVEAAFIKPGWELVDRVEGKEWATVVLQRDRVV